MDSLVFGRRPSPRQRHEVIYLDIKFHLYAEYYKLVMENAGEWKWYMKSCSGIPSHQVVSLINRAFDFGTAIDPKTEDMIEIWHKSQGSSGSTHVERFRFFRRIAKYVTEGSHINFIRQQQLGQWYFNGDCLIEKKGEILSLIHI